MTEGLRGTNAAIAGTGQGRAEVRSVLGVRAGELVLPLATCRRSSLLDVPSREAVQGGHPPGTATGLSQD